MPALAIGTVYAIGAMRDHVVSVDGRRIHVPVRALAIWVLAVASLTTAYLWAPLPWGRTEALVRRPGRRRRGGKPGS